MAAMGATTDTTENQRPDNLTFTRPMERSDYDTAMQMIRHKQYAEAIPHLQFALADKPQDVDILSYLGFAKRMVGDYDGALYYYQRALAIAPDHKGLHESMGEFDLAKNDLASAQKELATLATLCPTSCDERDALTKAIANYRSPSPTAAAGTASGAMSSSAPAGRP